MITLTDIEGMLELDDFFKQQDEEYKQSKRNEESHESMVDSSGRTNILLHRSGSFLEQ